MVSALRESWSRLAGPADRSAHLRVPTVLAVAAVLCQIAYPLVGGQARDVLTVATVLVFSAASLSHAWAVRGWRTAAGVAAVFVGGGLMVEVIGVATGFPFGSYDYSPRLGPMIAEVPLVIPLAWSMVGYPALVVARRMTSNRLLGVAIGGVALAAWDLFLDPQMVTEGYWSWSGVGPHLVGTVPVSNYVAWLFTAWVMMAAAWPLTRGWASTDDDRVPVALYLWTWAGSTLAHLAFFGLWQSGLYGGVGMGIVVVAFLIRSQVQDAPARTVLAADTLASDPLASDLGGGP